MPCLPVGACSLTAAATAFALFTRFATPVWLWRSSLCLLLLLLPHHACSGLTGPTLCDDISGYVHSLAERQRDGTTLRGHMYSYSLLTSLSIISTERHSTKQASASPCCLSCQDAR